MKTKRLQRTTLLGRDFTVKELRLIKAIVELYPSLSRKELSQTICENITWQAPNGKNKHNSCLRALEKLEAQGHIKPPSLRPKKGIRNSQVNITPCTDPGELVQGRIEQWGEVRINKVSRGQLSLWNEYVQRYHYLGYKIPFGLHLSRANA